MCQDKVLGPRLASKKAMHTIQKGFGNPFWICIAFFPHLEQVVLMDVWISGLQRPVCFFHCFLLFL